jgi:hypothetical protein
MVSVVSVAIGGLTVVMHQEGNASKMDVERSEALIHALELAETGLSRAAIEIASTTDLAGDGIGVCSGNYAKGSFSTTCKEDSNVWTIVSTGRVDKATRRVEYAIRRIEPVEFGAGIVSQGAINVSGTGTQTDSFDSRLGSYASQAVNTDAGGSYAGKSGTMKGNVDISVGTAIVRGDANPGPGYTTTINGGGSVTGSTTPMTETMSLPDPDYENFNSAFLSNDNGDWIVTDGANVNYDADKKTFAVSGGGLVTFPPGTYFFSKFSVAGNSTVRFTGLTTIYAVNNVDTTGGALQNATGLASNLQIIAHPYVFEGVPTTKSLSVSLSGGAQTALAVYAPQADVSLSGGGDFMGGIVGGTVKISGGVHFHYDLALGEGQRTAAQVERLYWRESTPPLR